MYYGRKTHTYLYNLGIFAGNTVISFFNELDIVVWFFAAAAFYLWPNVFGG